MTYAPAFYEVYEVHRPEGKRVRAGNGSIESMWWDAEMAAKEAGAPVVLLWGVNPDKATWKREEVRP